MGHEALKAEVCRVNREIGRTGLAILTWGNASGVDREAGVLAIKPSGIDYEELKPDDVVVLSLESGEVVEGDLRPSSDTPTHVHIARAFPGVGGVVHTHSTHATAWAQAGREIPCLGTTHADHFYGAVPATRALTRDEVAGNYELNTGLVIEEHFVEEGLDAVQVPGVLVANHGPFTWGPDAAAALQNARVLEAVAEMASLSLAARPGLGPIPGYLLDKHFLRKHGPGAYYGQR